MSLIQKTHLIFVAISLLLVSLSLMFSVFYLTQQWQLKHKRMLPLFSHLPSLERIDKYVVRFLILGAVSLSVLLVTGIYLAHLEWQSDWIQNEKFIAAIATWVWVLFTLFLRFRLGFRGEKFFYSILIGMFFLIASCTIAWMV
ncbi:MAG: cytochrome c biogenesis protein CcsA [Proteobacteria bacterium]|nr:cytochrome c biogenesis protein CcsA [Pseudomonadota bacterium]